MGAGAQKMGRRGALNNSNVRVVGVRGEAESVRAGAVEQILKAAGRTLVKRLRGRRIVGWSR